MAAYTGNSITLLQLLKGLDISWASEIERVLATAESVQRLRREKGVSRQSAFITRTSVVMAILKHRGHLLTSLEGFDEGLWEKEIDVRLDEIPSNAKFKPENFEPIFLEDWLGSLRNYVRAFPGRSLDAAALLWIILNGHAKGKVGDRLTASGLNIELALGTLHDQIKASSQEQKPGFWSDYPASQEVRSLLFQVEREAVERNIVMTFAPLFIEAFSRGGFLETGLANETLANYFRELLPARISGQGLSHEVLTALVEARRIAVQSSGREFVQLRHLLAALLETDPGHYEARYVEPVLNRFARDGGSLNLHLYHWIENEAPLKEDLAVWRELLLPELFARPPIAGFRSEGIEGPDRLGITPHVNAFAALMAAKSLEPPLSIGLFGDWGSGKSFFMEKLRQRIERLSTEAGRRETAQQQCAFHSRVIQVRFNAWNYVEANLWAGLVTHIFEKLHRHFSSREPGERRQLAELLKELDQGQKLSQEADATLRSAEQELGAARRRHAAKESSLTAAMGSVWAVLKESERKGDILEIEDSLRGQELKELQEQLFHVRGEAVALVEGTPIFWRVTLRRLLSVRSISWGVGAVLAVLAIYGALTALVGIDASWSVLTTGIAQLAMILGLLGGALSKVRRTLDAVASLERAVREGELPKEQELQEAEEEVEQAQRELNEHRERVAKLRGRLRDLSPGKRLSHFLEDRAESRDYRKHLGLPALIRRDFERLYQLMQPILFRLPREPEVEAALQEGRVPSAVRKVLLEVDLPLPTNEKVEVTPKGRGRVWRLRDEENDRSLLIWVEDHELVGKVDWHSLPRIDRIILYIDDLDRCPAEKVVEVLRAVHLLLSFPLFVVVVGVDAHWVSKALWKHHKDLWTDVESFGPFTGGTASPQDYLEKIFQIPFWLQPLEPKATRSYLRDLVADSLAKAGDTQLGPVTVESGHEGEGSITAAVQGEGIDASEPGEEASTQDDFVMSESDEFGWSNDVAITQSASVTGTKDDTALDDVTMNPASLSLEDREVELMERLAPLIGRSPRAVKRFVNTYRLIRATVPAVELPKFTGTGDDTGEYPAVLLLLALIAGAPSCAPDFFQELQAASPSQSLREFLGRIEESRSQIMDKAGSLWGGLVQFAEEFDKQGEWTMDRFQAWLLESRRFSFRVGRS